MLAGFTPSGASTSAPFNIMTAIVIGWGIYIITGTIVILLIEHYKERKTTRDERA
jgi:multisubunit Na+/H+ antiporter MnhC subunit